MSQNTSTPAKSNRAAKANAKTEAQPVADIIAQARAAGDSRSIAVAATMVANRPAKDLDDEAKAFIAHGGENVLAFDGATAAEVDVAANALEQAKANAGKARRIMFAYAYGVTNVSKVMTQKQLAKAWGTTAPRISNMVYAGRLHSMASLSDATTVAIEGYKNDQKTGAGELGIKPGQLDPAELAKIATDPKVTTDEDFRKAVATKVKGTRAANTKAKPNAPAAQRVYNLTLELDKIIQAGQIMPDGTVKDEPNLSAVENARALATKLDEYLSHHDATAARLAESKAKVEQAVGKVKARK